MVQNTAIRDDFEEEFMKWGAAIINYCKECQAKNSALQAAINITDHAFPYFTGLPVSSSLYRLYSSRVGLHNSV